jgi:hypothetical protein
MTVKISYEKLGKDPCGCGFDWWDRAWFFHIWGGRERNVCNGLRLFGVTIRLWSK